MEEEAREILRSTLGVPRASRQNLAECIRGRFVDLGGVELKPLKRDRLRPPPKFVP